MLSLHFCLNILITFSSCFVFLSENPVHSVLFLILTFCGSSGIMFIFHAEFLGLIFILVYVGAVAVLFLFVVMMLNTKTSINSYYLFMPIYLLSSIFILGEIFTVVNRTFFDYDFISNEKLINLEFATIDNLSNINAIGQSLYNYYVECFLICGLVLLVAMLGAINLTFTFSGKRKNEVVTRQLSKASNLLNHVS